MSLVEALCLAFVIYGEARSEPQLGQVAVAHVVLNRPQPICTTVYEPHQFAPPDKIREPEAFTAALQLALTLPPVDPSKGATHFFSGPEPYWASTLSQTVTIGPHRFFK